MFTFDIHNSILTTVTKCHQVEHNGEYLQVVKAAQTYVLIVVKKYSHLNTRYSQPEAAQTLFSQSLKGPLPPSSMIFVNDAITGILALIHLLRVMSVVPSLIQMYCFH